MTKLLNNIFSKYTSDGLRTSIRNMRRELIILRMHRRGVRNSREFYGQTGLKLNFGCGPKIKHGWINIDLSDSADITLDLREKIPFSDNSCSTVYSEHFLEHLDYPGHAENFLEECYRILEPGGIFNVGVPDTQWPLNEYDKNIAKGYFSMAKEHWHPAWCTTELEHINYHFRQNNQHRFAYDFKTLVHVLGNAGFKEIRRRDFDQNMDSADRKSGTLYALASKPTG